MDSINTERSYTEYEVTEPTTDFAIGFDNYSGEDKDAIHITLDGVNLDNLNYTVVRKNAQVIEVTPAIKSGVVRLQRETYIDQAFHTFTAGALFSPKSMDENFGQVRRSQQEVNDGFVYTTDYVNNTLSAYDTRIIEVEDSQEGSSQRLATEVQARKQGDLDSRRYAEDILGMGNIWDGISTRSVVDTETGLTQADINATQKLDTAITATAKNGGVARQLSEVLSETVSINSFATPDAAYAYAISNNTKLFVPNGDYSITATNIDYSVFYGEGFVNGAAVGYSRKPEQAQTLNVQELLNSDNIFDRYRVTRGGDSATRTAQDFTVDNLTDELFVQHIHGSGSDEAGVITRYNSIRATQAPLRWLKTPDSRIGHQGFNTFRDAKGDRWFVTSAGQATANKGGKCVFFKIADDPNDETGLLVSDFREVVLFDVVSNQHCTTATSLNDRYLISKLYMPNNEIIIRIHDLQKIVNSTTSDFSNDYINQFTVNVDYIDKPLQSITCNNNLVYLFLGSSSIAEDALPICIVTDMLGVEVYRATFAPARSQALLDGSGTYYEVEGTGWTYVGDVPKLSVMIMSGNSGGRICRIYQLGARDSSITATVRDSRRKPAFISEAVNDFAVPHDEGLIIGHYDADNDFFYKGMEIDTDQNVSFSSKNSGSLKVTLHDSPTGGNASSTSGSGTFTRVGNLVFVNIFVSGISTTGMTDTSNLVVRLSATGTNFKLPSSASCLSMSCNNYTPFEGTFMTTPTFSGGVLYFRDCIVGGSVEIADVAQFEGVSLQISGCYQVS